MNVKSGDVAVVTSITVWPVDGEPMPVVLAGTVVIVGKLNVWLSIKRLRPMWRVEAPRHTVLTHSGPVSFDILSLADCILRRIPPGSDGAIRDAATDKPLKRSPARG